MSNDKDNMGLSEKKYNEIYDANIIGCIDSISRSYSSGINAPSVSSNRLRVCSTDSSCAGPLRVRSSPSSPNRLTRFQCMTLVRRKWSAINKQNQSSSSEFDSYPTSCNSNKSLQCDSNIDQLDLSWRHESSTCSLTNRPTSCQNLKVNDLSTHNQDDFYPLTGDLQTILYGSSSTSHLLKPLTGAIDEEPTDKRLPKSKTEVKSSKVPMCFIHKESRSMALKSSANPINFKKALRDRYLNSQRSSNISTGKSVLSSQHITQAKSLTDDYLLQSSEFILKDNEDHNFRFIQERENRQSFDSDQNFGTKSIYESDHKKSLSIDLQNLSALKKYRIRSNNSNVSSMSGIEAEGDPFSPASTEICSPFLKLNLPYRVVPKQMSGSETPNTVPSLGTITSTHETQSYPSSKLFESLLTQRFFPDTMKLSDFHSQPSFKSDCQLNFTVKERLLLPETGEYHASSRSAPQSLQLSPNCTHLLSGTVTPVTGATSTESAHSLTSSSYVPLMISVEDDRYFTRPIISSKSMDHLDSFYHASDIATQKGFKEYDTDWRCDDESRDKDHDLITASSGDHKLKHPSSVSHRKLMSAANTSNQRQCPVCGRHFNRSDMLARHSRVHTGHKPFECSICGQSFSRSDHLNTHMRIHSGEKPYRCSLCPYSACRRDMITRHLRVHRRKGDISQESVSVLVINTQRPTTATTIHNKKSSITKSQNSLNLDLDVVSDEEDLLTLHRSLSFHSSQHNRQFQDHNISSSQSSRTTEPSCTVVPQTFANISISICQPTPRSSFSMPMESHNNDS